MNILNAVTPLSNTTGYGSHAIRTDRDNEYTIFSRVTRLLREADPDCKTAEAITAVHKNNELWTLLAADLSHPDNALPDETKAGLLSLAGFSVRHGHSLLAGIGSIQALIDINMSIMKGLRGEVAV